MGKICFHQQKTARERIADHNKICKKFVKSIKSSTTLKRKKSPIELRLLKAMKKRNLNPISQYKILNFKVDFAFPDKKLVIECDGSKYHGDPGTLWSRQDYEARRHFLIKKEGWKFLRFSGFEIQHRADEIANYILRSLGLQESGSRPEQKNALSLAGNGPICSEKAQPERTTRKRTIARRQYSFIPRPFNGGRRSHLSADEKELLKNIRGIP